MTYETLFRVNGHLTQWGMFGLLCMQPMWWWHSYSHAEGFLDWSQWPGQRVLPIKSTTTCPWPKLSFKLEDHLWFDLEKYFSYQIYLPKKWYTWMNTSSAKNVEETGPRNHTTALRHAICDDDLSHNSCYYWNPIHTLSLTAIISQLIIQISINTLN